ncbi:MAG: hypothetical protein SFT91_00995 [Rickettsiaceae bacterium]|nr:hypothetical protein [Rickettsiaceae bacterium]
MKKHEIKNKITPEDYRDLIQQSLLNAKNACNPINHDVFVADSGSIAVVYRQNSTYSPKNTDQFSKLSQDKEMRSAFTATTYETPETFISKNGSIALFAPPVWNEKIAPDANPSKKGFASTLTPVSAAEKFHDELIRQNLIESHKNVCVPLGKSEIEDENLEKDSRYPSKPESFCELIRSAYSESFNTPGKIPTKLCAALETLMINEKEEANSRSITPRIHTGNISENSALGLKDYTSEEDFSSHISTNETKDGVLTGEIGKYAHTESHEN